MPLQTSIANLPAHRHLTITTSLCAFVLYAILNMLVAAAASPGTISVASTAFHQGAVLPARYTGDGENVSPPLYWSKPPIGTKTIALTCEDPDAPAGTWWHWMLYNVSPKTQAIGEGVPKAATMIGGVKQGLNDFNRVGYDGPAPPPGYSHRYQFKVMALDTVLNLPPSCTKDAFRNATRGHVLAEGATSALYWRK